MRILSWFTLALVAGFTVAAQASTTVTVGTTSDGTGTSPLTLRAAINQANAASAAGLPFIIQVPSGTYKLTAGELALGPGVGSGPANKVSIIGLGTAANTIVMQTDGQNRVFNLDPNSAGGSTFALANLTISGGHDGADGFGGGGILTGNTGNGSADLLNLTNCVIATNSTTGDGAGLGAAGGSVFAIGCTFIKNSLAGGGTMEGAGCFFLPYNNGDTMTAINCFFLQNTIKATGSGQEAQGAALVVDTDNVIGSLAHITNCVFGSNSVSSTSTPVGQDYGGGAIYIGAVSTVQIIGCTFTNNVASASVGGASGTGGNGGAILAQENQTSVLVEYCRFVGNVAASGGASGVWGFTDGSSHITANDNWWGSDSGPGSAVSHITTLTDWLILTNTAGSSVDALGAADSLTASFLTDSAGNAIAPANLGALTNLTITFGGVDGSISGAQAVIGASGTATATFTGTVSGAGSGSATVDGVTSSASINVEAGITAISSSPASKAYRAGQTVPITVTFGGVATVTGTPQLALNDARSATYASGSGTATLTFNYVVVSGDTSAHLDYSSTIALTLNGGTISSGGVAAVLTLPAPGATGSLGANTTIVIDTTSPTLNITGTPPATGGSSSATFTFTDSDSGSGIASVTYQLDGGALIAATSPVNLTGLGDGAHTFALVATDAAGNTSSAAYHWTVGSAPSITVQPADLSVTYSSNATFSVTAGGSLPLAYQWYFGGTAINGAVAASYSLTDVTMINAGNYKVVITNVFGAITSRVAVLTVNPGTPVVGLISSRNPVGYHAAVSFTASLPSDATGNVVFSSGLGVISTNALSGGSATSVTITNLPRGTNLITAVYAGDQNYSSNSATLNQVVTNHPPVIGVVTNYFMPGTTSLINITNLLASSVTDVDGDSPILTSVSVSTNGVVPTTNAVNILYLNGNNVNDRFNYTVSDGFGGTATGRVIMLASPYGVFGQAAPTIVTANGAATITFYGIPGYPFTVYRSTNGVSGPYLPVWSTNAPVGGQFKFSDTPLFPSAFYRLANP